MDHLVHLTNPAALTTAYTSEHARVLDECGRVNVLLAGNSGVGKSTVINAIFGDEVAQTGVGNPQTMSIVPYEPPERPLRIYDTRGFEIAKAEETVAAVRGKISELRSKVDPRDQIHIVWTCILEQSHRIEPVQQGLLRMLRDQQPNVPAIVLITQAFEGNAEMEAKVRELAIPNNGVIPILATEKRIGPHLVPPRGVDELVETTLRLLPEAQKHAFIAAQTARWDLKERAVTNRINTAAVAAASSSLIPVPGGHSVALLSIQMGMLAWINSYLGITINDSGGKDVIKGLIGIVVAKAGGQTAFWMVLSEATKLFPGLGTLGAAAVGGPIAAALTKTLGHVYLDTVKQYAKSDLPLPPPDELAQTMQRLLELNRDRYRSIGTN